MVWKRSSNVHKDGVLMLRQVLQNVLIRHVEVGEIRSVVGRMVFVELICQHQPDFTSLYRRNAAFNGLQKQSVVSVKRSRRLTYVIIPHLMKLLIAWYDLIVVQFHPTYLVLTLTLLKASILFLHSQQEDNLFACKFP